MEFTKLADVLDLTIEIEELETKVAPGETVLPLPGTGGHGGHK